MPGSETTVLLVDEPKLLYEEQSGSEHCPEMQSWTEKCLKRQKLQQGLLAVCALNFAWLKSFLYNSPFFGELSIRKSLGVSVVLYACFPYITCFNQSR